MTRPHFHHLRIQRARQRGISLMMVTAFVAAASVMSLSILSSNMLQASASAGQATVLQADSLAESAMNRALYFIQNVDNTKCPSTIATMGTYNESNGSLGAAVGGSYTLRVKGAGTNKWDITATGIATSTRGSITRRLLATVEANYFGYAIAFGPSGSPAIPASVTINGDVYAPADVSNAGIINGILYGTSISNSGVATALRSVTGMNQTPVPAQLGANHYAVAYTFNGKAGTPTLLLTTSLTNTTLGPTLTNPAGIYYALTDVTFNGNVKINGTLVINGAKLKVKGTGNAITAQTGTPAVAALVCDSDINFFADNSALDVSGLTWLGGRITRTGTSGAGCQLNINGVLLAYNGSVFDASLPTVITYNRSKASVPGFWMNLTRPPAPTHITVLGWTN